MFGANTSYVPRNGVTDSFVDGIYLDFSLRGRAQMVRRRSKFDNYSLFTCSAFRPHRKRSTSEDGYAEE